METTLTPDHLAFLACLAFLARLAFLAARLAFFPIWPFFPFGLFSHLAFLGFFCLYALRYRLLVCIEPQGGGGHIHPTFTPLSPYIDLTSTLHRDR